ncbi:sugar ABC transporter permease [Pseudomonas caspiana]|uniref:carbohydrate ABC transporter permease n=1 Tax=Pseudomonas caspiana TaxID=1451454 RepID=UPI0032EEB925
MNANAVFPQKFQPLLYALPQLLALAIFFYWPAIQALWWSLNRVQPFGGRETYVGLDNYRRILTDPGVLDSLQSTLIFSLSSVSLSIVMALILAASLELNVRGRRLWRNLLVWPYAVSGAVAGIIFNLLANPVIGLLAWLNEVVPELWAPHANPNQSMVLLIVAYSWCLMPLNFVILSASLQSVPDDYLAAAKLDGANAWQRLRDIQLPMITPYLLLVFVIDLLESLSNSFGLVDTLTHGGPGDATNIIAYKIYSDGFIGLDLAGSSTLSVLMLMGVIILSFIQFRVLAKRKRIENQP